MSLLSMRFKHCALAISYKRTLFFTIDIFSSRAIARVGELWYSFPLSCKWFSVPFTTLAEHYERQLLFASALEREIEKRSLPFARVPFDSSETREPHKVRYRVHSLERSLPSYDTRSHHQRTLRLVEGGSSFFFVLLILCLTAARRCLLPQRASESESFQESLALLVIAAQLLPTGCLTFFFHSLLLLPQSDSCSTSYSYTHFIAVE